MMLLSLHKVWRQKDETIPKNKNEQEFTEFFSTIFAAISPDDSRLQQKGP